MYSGDTYPNPLSRTLSLNACSLLPTFPTFEFANSEEILPNQTVSFYFHFNQFVNNVALYTSNPVLYPPNTTLLNLLAARDILHTPYLA